VPLFRAAAWVVLLALFGSVTASVVSPSVAAGQDASSVCVESTGDEITDQRSINDYSRSFNRDLMGQTPLMDLFTNNGADLDAYVPVMGRGQTIAIASEEYLDPALYQEFEAVGPRTYEWYNFFGTVDDPTFGDIGSHGASVFIKAVPGALGARGTTDIQSWRSAFSSAIRAWIVAQNGGETTPFLSSWQPPDVVNYSSVTGMSRAMEHWIDEYDGVLAIAAGNGGRVPGGNGGYNAISVGASPRTWDRLETSHITQDNPSFGSPGRSKPDIVVSNGNVFTSFQAPVITAYVARLREAAVCYHTSTTDALRSETLKAVLLAGADQTIAFDDTDWTWTRTTEFPIDRRFGAGTADIHESFLIVREGESDAVSIDSSPPAGWSTIGSSPARGWDYIAELEANSSVALAIPGGAASVNLAATWPYEVTNLVTFAEGRVADINLEVFGVADGCEAVSVQQSRSPIDNVEYLRLVDPLAADRYTVVVTNESDFAAEVALAWTSEPGGTMLQPGTCPGATQAPLGEVTCDNVVDVGDALAIAQYVAGERVAVAACPLPDPATGIVLDRADVNVDGAIDGDDAALVLTCLVGGEC